MSTRVDLYTYVYNAVNTNMSSYGASTSNITLYGGFPDIETITFPNIIIEPIQSNDEGNTKTIGDRAVGSKVMAVIIHIFAKRNRDLDIIADGINGTLDTLSTPGYLFNDTSDQNSFLTANDQKVKGKTLTITYLKR